jgi:hypothetical protein
MYSAADRWRWSFLSTTTFSPFRVNSTVMGPHARK